MLTIDQINELEKLIGQLIGLHTELATLSKKSPNDAVNSFKLRFVNEALIKCNKLLGAEYKPFEDFNQFNDDDIPSNSDVTLVLSQYMQSLEKLRSDNVYIDFGTWYYKTKDKGNKIQTGPPTKLKK
ncbi:hypothetical protein KJ966_17220 [bacterium]|nr:hypothetical protein [bacterium]